MENGKDGTADGKGCFFMIGFFDSGFGGLTVLKSVAGLLPEYDYLYLGDNARVPYGSRSQKIVYEFTRQAVNYLFHQGCPLIIIACNTASARALRRIQQEFLPEAFPERPVPGVTRPWAEGITATGYRRVGILATEGVVSSRIYIEEIRDLDPAIRVYQEPCPLLVPIIEAGERDWEGTDLIVKKYIEGLFSRDRDIEAVLLGCTHYPILHGHIQRAVPPGVSVLDQGPIVARKLKDYLHRHPEIDEKLSRKGLRAFLTTDRSDRFDDMARIFYGETIRADFVSLESLCF